MLDLVIPLATIQKHMTLVGDDLLDKCGELHALCDSCDLMKRILGPQLRMAGQVFIDKEIDNGVVGLLERQTVDDQAMIEAKSKFLEAIAGKFKAKGVKEMKMVKWRGVGWPVRAMTSVHCS